MKYLFFDIECCDGRHICEFGYVIIDSSFNILERDFFLINPQSKFDLTGRDGRVDLELSFPEKKYKSSPKFNAYHKRIKDLIEAPDQTVIGFSILNDACYLNNASKRYKLPSIDFEFLDIQRMYSNLCYERGRPALEALAEKFGVENFGTLHKSDDDAVYTMELTKAICEYFGENLEGLSSRSIDAHGKNENYHASYFEPSDEKIIEMMKEHPKAVASERKARIIYRLVTRELDADIVKDGLFNGKSVGINSVIIRENPIRAIKLIDLLMKQGAVCLTKGNKCDYYLLDEAETQETSLRYAHILENIKEGNDVKLLRYSDILFLIGTTWELIDISDIPEIPEGSDEHHTVKL